jgi:hypothetical protein
MLVELLLLLGVLQHAGMQRAQPLHVVLLNCAVDASVCLMCPL